jgi:hypothetical protein
MLIAILTEAEALGAALTGDLASTLIFLAAGWGALIKLAGAEIDDDALASLSGR